MKPNSRIEFKLLPKFLSFIFMAFLTSAAVGDPLGAGDGAYYRMGPDATFQEGCFEPCACPIGPERPVIGAFKLVHAGLIDGMQVYGVHDLNLRLPDNAVPHRINGYGVYRIGSPDATTVLMHRMQLTLHMGGNAVQEFDSGWLHFAQNTPTGINIVVSINGLYCLDQVIRIDADRVSSADVVPYALDFGSTYQHGCFDPCDCILEDERPMIGEFTLVTLSDDGNLREYAVMGVDWLALSPHMATGTFLHGNGFYRNGGNALGQHQMGLDLVAGDDPPAHWNSGMVGGGVLFPVIDITMTRNNFVCLDTVLHIVARPNTGEICGGFTGIPCEDPNDFCNLPIGDCCCDFLGTCTPRPDACPENWDPVCGCDNVTYGNVCEAAREGVSIQHLGACGESCGRPDDPPCPNDSFCKFPTGSCGPTQTGGGVCRPNPQGCPDVWDPVCGCDDTTYSNECDADAAGVSIAHYGPCQKVCGGISGVPCDDGEFCKFPPGLCNVSDLQGVCRPIPQACPLIYDPVCGCDGNTYGNECEADAAQVAIDHEGPCASPACAATRQLLTGNATYCPNTAVGVRIDLQLPAGTAAIAIEDTPPAGWTVGNISHDGTYDAVNHKVKWGPFFAPFPPHVSYTTVAANDTISPKCFSGTLSIDGSSDVICGDACLEACCPHMAADRPQPECLACAVADCRDCANAGCQNGHISLCEVIGYACSWLRGCNDDIAGVTRAAYIWRNGECYCWSESDQNWFPSTCSASGNVCCGDDENAPRSAVSGEPVPTGSAKATIKPTTSRQNRTSEWTITIYVEPPPGASGTAVQLSIPKGWKATSRDGAFDPANRKFKWGPFYDSATRKLSVQAQAVSPPRPKEKISRLAPTAGGLTEFSGIVSFDGMNQPIEFGR